MKDSEEINNSIVHNRLVNSVFHEISAKNIATDNANGIMYIFLRYIYTYNTYIGQKIIIK